MAWLAALAGSAGSAAGAAGSALGSAAGAAGSALGSAAGTVGSALGSAAGTAGSTLGSMLGSGGAAPAGGSNLLGAIGQTAFGNAPSLFQNAVSQFQQGNYLNAAGNTLAGVNQLKRSNAQQRLGDNLLNTLATPPAPQNISNMFSGSKPNYLGAPPGNYSQYS